MPVDDLPIHFPNSVAATNGSAIRVPSDVVAQWAMLRWAKSRGGVLLADRFGATWCRGGDLAQTDSPFTFSLSPCEAWPLEEIVQEERLALRMLTTGATTVIVGTAPGGGGPLASLIAMAVSRDTARIEAYPITLPSATRAATYMEVTNLANTVVPLWAVMPDPVRGADYAALHDLRLRPFGVVCQDRTTDPDTQIRAPFDTVGGWYVLRNYRVWFYAPANALFEVCASATHVRPYDPRIDDVQIALSADRTLERRLSVLVNGQLAGSVDSTAGVEVVSGLVEATTQPNPYNPNVISPEQPVGVRLVFRSLANAVHDIAIAVYITQGQTAYQYVAQVKQPQILARLVAPEPQFVVSDTGGSGSSSG